MSFKMGNNVFVLLLTLILFIGGVYSVSVPSSPATIVNGLLSSAVSLLMKWILSLKATTNTGRPVMKFESGYTVETVFDGSKLGVEPYSVEVLPDGNILILDSANSNLYTISSSLSLYSRPKLVTGSAEGYYGHIDGRLREARMNHPKGLTVDDRGNIYVADTDNMAIRKISDAGVSTIAGGKQGRGARHVDGPSEDAKFSNDFDVVYIGSSCSILVIDRGNKAIREIQLHYDDCANQYGSVFPSGVAVLIAAGFFGYMVAMLQRKVTSSQDDYRHEMKKQTFPPYQHQTPSKSSWSPIIEHKNQEESFLGSFGRLVTQTGASAAEILGGFFPSLKPLNHHHHQQHKYSNTYPVQECFVIPDEDAPPTRTPPPLKTYPFMSNDSEKMQKLRQGHVFYNGLEGDFTKKEQHHYHSSAPKTYFQD